MSVQVEIMEELSELCGIDRIGVLSPEAPYSLSFAGGKEIKKYLNGTAIRGLWRKSWGIFAASFRLFLRLVCLSLRGGRYEIFPLALRRP